MKKFFLYFFLISLITTGTAQVKTEKVSYTDGETELEGYFAYDKLLKSKRGGVLLIHDRNGHDEFIQNKAEELAKLGYIAFALDMYGKGVLAKDEDEAEDLSEPFLGETRDLMRTRAKAGLEILKKHKKIDSNRLVAIGYGFGGTVVLELARSGENLAGVTAFYADLSTPFPQDANNIKGSVLIFRGADDSIVIEEEISAFETEMRNANVDWLLVNFGNAVNSFSYYSLGFEVSGGKAYNYNADKRSWEILKIFIREKIK